MSGFLAVCVRFSLHRGRGWEGEVSKWFLFCSRLVFSRSFVHDRKTAKCFPKQGEPKFVQIRAKSKAALKFDMSVMLSDLHMKLLASNHLYKGFSIGWFSWTLLDFTL